jgi:O-methyltransferase
MTGTLLAERASGCGVEDTVYLCDTFTGVVKASDKDPTYRGGEHADASRSTVERLLSSRNLSNARILEGIFPEESARFLDWVAFRLCHIDVDVYRSARDSAEWLWPRLVPGGVVVYDDYGSAGCSGITLHVDEQVSSSDRVVLHNLNGHAVVVKIR